MAISNDRVSLTPFTESTKQTFSSITQDDNRISAVASNALAKVNSAIGSTNDIIGKVESLKNSLQETIQNKLDGLGNIGGLGDLSKIDSISGIAKQIKDFDPNLGGKSSGLSSIGKAMYSAICNGLPPFKLRLPQFHLDALRDLDLGLDFTICDGRKKLDPLGSTLNKFNPLKNGGKLVKPEFKSILSELIASESRGFLSSLGLPQSTINCLTKSMSQQQNGVTADSLFSTNMLGKSKLRKLLEERCLNTLDLRVGNTPISQVSARNVVRTMIRTKQYPKTTTTLTGINRVNAYQELARSKDPDARKFLNKLIETDTDKRNVVYYANAAPVDKPNLSNIIKAKLPDTPSISPVFKNKKDITALFARV